MRACGIRVCMCACVCVCVGKHSKKKEQGNVRIGLCVRDYVCVEECV